MLKAALRTWRKSLPGNFSQTRASIQAIERAEESRPLTEAEFESKSQLKAKYLSTLKKEELYSYQRSRVKWLKTGDLNTQFFHRIANCSRSDNSISTIKVNNSYLVQPAAIEQAFLSYFQTLYTTPVAPRLAMMDLDFMTLTEAQALGLECPFLEDEIFKAINDLPKDKAPRLDGFPIAPFKLFWETFRSDLLSSLRNSSTGEFCIRPLMLLLSLWYLRSKGSRSSRTFVQLVF
ncbi:hypothetical protein AMTRI_Chr05g74440 [Amborella trichopoda]